MPRSGGISAWSNSLIVTTLKRGSLYLIPLAADGKTPRGPLQRYFQSENRYRDTAISPDMKTIYVATDPGGLTESASGGVTQSMQNPGAILAFTFAGDGQSAAGVATPAPAADSASSSETSAAGGIAPVFTAAQALRGRTAYDANCVSCHGHDLINAHYGPPLAGPYFEGKWAGRSVASLYQAVRDRMPPSRPAALTPAAYADIVALILETNGVPSGSSEMSSTLGELEPMTITLPAAQ
jgi:mono/diheme cytochrome c family protein